MRHKRNGHYHIPGLQYGRCEACDVIKSRMQGHKKQKPEYVEPTARYQQVDFDYKGPWEPSIKGDKVWLLTSVDAYKGCPWVEVYPV